MSNRNIKDASKQVTKALPAAAASANTDSIDLGPNPGQIENVEVEIVVEATTALVDTKDIDVKLQDSADDSSFADIAEFADPVLKVTSDGGGSDETKLQVRLPRTVRRYIRAVVSVETGGGSVIANNAILRLVF
jgi:hypothetical protein